MRTRAQIVQSHQVDSSGICQADDAFRGQPAWVPYYWDMVLSGLAPYESQEGVCWYFPVMDEDIQEFPELDPADCVSVEVKGFLGIVGARIIYPGGRAATEVYEEPMIPDCDVTVSLRRKW